MPKKKKGKKIEIKQHHLIRRRCRRLHFINLIIGFLTIICLSSYFFLAGPGVFSSQAATMTFGLLIGEIVPTPEVEVTPIPGGIPTLPSLEVLVFVRGEENLPAYIRILKIDNLVVENIIGPIRITNSQPNFSGKTNLKNAILFIEISSLGRRIFTTYADEKGLWSWQTPILLGEGSQTINITAISPADPRVRAGTFLSFEIISGEAVTPPYLPTPPISPRPGQPPEITPGPAPTTTAPVIPGQPPQPPAGEPRPPVIEPEKPPLPPIEERVKKLISLNLQVLNKDKKIYPKEKVLTKTEILNLGEEPLRLNLKYDVISPQNEIVSTSNNEVDLETALTVGKDYQTSFTIKTGLYTIRVETEVAGVIFSSQDKFEVIEKPLVKLPGEVIITERQAAEGVLAISLILLILLIYFLLLLRREYKKVLLLPPIDEKNLWQRGEIR